MPTDSDIWGKINAYAILAKATYDKDLQQIHKLKYADQALFEASYINCIPAEIHDHTDWSIVMGAPVHNLDPVESAYPDTMPNMNPITHHHINRLLLSENSLKILKHIQAQDSPPDYFYYLYKNAFWEPGASVDWKAVKTYIAHLQYLSTLNMDGITDLPTLHLRQQILFVNHYAREMFETLVNWFTAGDNNKQSVSAQFHRLLMTIFTYKSFVQVPHIFQVPLWISLVSLILGTYKNGYLMKLLEKPPEPAPQTVEQMMSEKVMLKLQALDEDIFIKGTDAYSSPDDIVIIDETDTLGNLEKAGINFAELAKTPVLTFSTLNTSPKYDQVKLNDDLDKIISDLDTHDASTAPTPKKETWWIPAQARVNPEADPFLNIQVYGPAGNRKYGYAYRVYLKHFDPAAAKWLIENMLKGGKYPSRAGGNETYHPIILKAEGGRVRLKVYGPPCNRDYGISLILSDIHPDLPKYLIKHEGGIFL